MDLAWQGLILGLSTGIYCLGACVPVLVPALLVASRSWRSGASVVGEVALGRLLAYLAFGAAVGAIGAQLDATNPLLGRLEGAAMLGLALVLGAYVAFGSRAGSFRLCGVAPFRKLRTPLAIGLLTGVSVCPPFLLALATALGAGGPVEGALFFAAFFVGTSVYLLPLIPIGRLGSWEVARVVGRMSGGLSAALFVALGTVRLLA